MAKRIIALFILAWAGTKGAEAIVVDAGSYNGSDPSNGLPWANVGIVNGSASGIYLGNGWVLSAQHVTGSDVAAGGVSFVLGSTTYTNASTVITLTKDTDHSAQGHREDDVCRLPEP